jgi:hypothetical protein
VEGFSGACGAMTADAMIDGNPSVDSDGDGKNDSIDNCRAIPNPDQANEDGDVFGDACDPCPPYATFTQGGTQVDANVDSDGDGIGNGCDPNPMTLGDRLRVFEAFASNATPTGTTTAGMWTFSNGQAHVVAISGQIATLYFVSPMLKVDTARRDTITTRMTLTMSSTGTTSTGAGILDPMDANLHGVGCFNGFTGSTRELLLLDTFATGPAAALIEVPGPIPMMGDLKLVRDANGARTVCSILNFTTPAANGNVPPNNNQVGLRAISMNSDFDWFMWIDSPP